MTEEASADDIQVQDFLKKKKKKKKIHKEHNEKHENYERESVQNEELLCTSPLLLEDRAAQSGEGYKKKKKRKNKGEEQQPSLVNSCVELEHEISDETGVDTSKKKRKKKKPKCHDSADQQSDVNCVTVNQHLTDYCQEINAYVKQSAKKKRKEKLPEGEEVYELSTSETCDKNENERAKKKKKKKKRERSTEDMQEDTAVTIDQSLLSPKKKRKRKDKDLPLPAEEVDVAAPQQCHEDGDCDSSPAVCEDSPDVPANFSKLSKAADQSHRNTSVCTKKEDTALTIDQSLLPTPKKKKKRKKKDRVLLLSTEEVDVATPQQCHEDRDAFPAIREDSLDVPANFSNLTKAADQSHQKALARTEKEETALTIDQSLLSSPKKKKKRKKKDRVLLLSTEEVDVLTPQQCHEDGDSDAFPTIHEDSPDVPANFSKLTKAADQSHQKALERAEKEDTAVSIDQSLLPSPKEKKKRKKKHRVLLLSTEEVDVATPQKCHEDGDSDAFPAICEDSPDVPANFSKLKKANDQSHRKALAHAEEEDTAVSIDQSLLSSPKKKKKRKKKDRVLLLSTEEADVATPQQCHEDSDCDAFPAIHEDSLDVPANFSKLNKAADRSNRKTLVPAEKEDTAVSIDQSLLSSPKKKREKKDKVFPLPTEEVDVAAPQQRHEDDDCDSSVRKDSLDVPANFSKLSKAADQSHQTLVRATTRQEDPAVSIEQSLLSSPKQKRKRKDKVLLSPAAEVDVTAPQQCHGDCDSSPVRKDSPDVPANFSKLNKAADRSHRKTLEDTAATVDQSLLSPKQKKKREDTVLPLPTEEVGVAVPQQCHEDGDCDSSPVREDSPDVPANFSKLNKAADQSRRKTPARAKKVVKSRAFVMEESSSESDEMTAEPSASNRKKDRSSSFNVDSRMSSAMDLETAKKELEEFIPNVRSIAECSIRKMAGKDLARFKQFKEQGIAVRFGKFSQKENDQIRKNIEEFLSTTGIDSAEKLLFTSRYPEEQKDINRLKAKHHFCDKLSEGIPRPWRLVYYRAKKIFDPNNYKGRYSKAEKEELKKYHALHGNDWKKISEMMSRSSLSVAMKYSQIKSAVNYGPWSKEEVQKLKRAVEEVIRKRVGMEDANSRSSSEKSGTDRLIDQETLYQKLPWTEIETKVGTRHWRQCKQKWMIILTNKMTKGQPSYRGAKAMQAKISLIKRLHEMQVKDYSEVKWEELTDIVGNVPAVYIQSKFYRLKVTSVPFWQKKTFSEIIDYLYEKKLPELEEMLESRKGKRNSSDNSTATNQKKAFRLSDIFDSSEDSD